jgi:sarcosine oxidase
MQLHDVVVVGAGGMGSAAAFHLARRGLSVRVIEQFSRGHTLGSSHGLSRIIRLAYFEHPSYVPLLRRAFALWRELEEAAEARLLHVTGAFDAGRAGSRVVEGSLDSCRTHALPYELLTADAVNERFPGYRLPADHLAVLQPDGGFLEPERCIEAHIGLAVRHGARVDQERTVRSWQRVRGGVEVATDHDVVRARQLVLCAGAWMPRLLPVLAPVLTAERQVVAWFEARDPELFSAARFPVFNLETDAGHFYGFPQFGVPGFKIGKYHHRREVVEPGTMDRDVHPADEEVLRACVRQVFPRADGPVLHATACLFTNTPDEHFVIDRLPDAPEVMIVSACSGHGFKFCTVVGEIVADLVADRATRHDISRFRLDRFIGG